MKHCEPSKEQMGPSRLHVIRKLTLDFAAECCRPSESFVEIAVVIC